MSAGYYAECPKCKNQRGLREEWEIGIFDGEFYMHYDSRCGDCGYRFERTHREPA